MSRGLQKLVIWHFLGVDIWWNDPQHSNVLVTKAHLFDWTYSEIVFTVSLDSNELAWNHFGPYKITEISNSSAVVVPIDKLEEEQSKYR
ncbi:hypothetical protein niasHT_032993 [Heterodera trifolii]|uniref:Uncharacterized protein n=1 Tax=Heterodera trifolii TaxID=157864 RepID=A0ABD2IKW8_9BILA